MLTKMVLKNCKSFHEIEFDLLSQNQTPKSLAVVYGENGSGKSNLVSAFAFLINSMNTIDYLNLRNKLMHPTETSDDKEEFSIYMYERYYSRIPTNLLQMATEMKTIDTEEDMLMQFHFIIDDKPGYYEMIFDDSNRLIKEKLYYLIKERVGTLYSINRLRSDKINIEFSSSFTNNNTKKILEECIYQYWGKHTLLAIIKDQLNQKNEEYFFDTINQNFFAVYNYFKNNFSVSSTTTFWMPLHSINNNRFLLNIDEGSIPLNKETILLSYEQALNSFFTRLYSDIKSVYYKIDKEGDCISYELYLRKMIGGMIREIPFGKESTGTKKLLDIFPYLIDCVSGKTVIIDEIDSGIHDSLVTFLLEDLSENFKGQLIVTTHNTLLLEALSPDSEYIITVDSMGEKTIETIKDTYRNSHMKIQKNHNHMLRYISGLYGGVPFPQSLDILDIVDMLKTKDIDK